MIDDRGIVSRPRAAPCDRAPGSPPANGVKGLPQIADRPIITPPTVLKSSALGSIGGPIPCSCEGLRSAIADSVVAQHAGAPPSGAIPPSIVTMEPTPCVTTSPHGGRASISIATADLTLADQVEDYFSKLKCLDAVAPPISPTTTTSPLKVMCPQTFGPQIAFSHSTVWSDH
jgi:hypothetical protein